MKKNYLTIIILSAFFLAVAAFFIYKNLKIIEIKKPINNEANRSLLKPLITLKNSFYENDSFNSSIEKINKEKTKDNIYAVISPHHLIASDLIAEIIKLPSGKKINKIIVIGPNHNNIGLSRIISAEAIWETPFGPLETDDKLTEKFITDFDLRPNSEAFENEHSIGALVPFIKKYYPEAKIVPIIFNSYAGLSEAEKVWDWLNNNLDDNSLIIVSTDFSHYLAREEAEKKDIITRELIEEENIGKITNLNNDYIDSPAGLATAVYFADKRGLKPNFINHANSFDLAENKSRSTTSYFTIAFLKDDATSSVKMLFFGDLMLDRHVKEKINKRGLDFLLSKLVGKNFFNGFDLISANLEGAITHEGAHYAPILENDFAFSPGFIVKLNKYNFNFFNLSNNHLTDQGEKGVEETRDALDNLNINYAGCSDGTAGDCSGKILKIGGKKIGIVGLSMVYRKINIDDAKSIIKDTASSSDFLIVNTHWGSEYQHKFSSFEQEFAYGLIDAGADLIIGHHPHVVQGLEIYKNKPVFYSLGNFIFDQYFSLDTEEGLAVSLTLDNKSAYYNLFPFKSSQSQPSLMEGDEKAKFFNKFIEWSKIDENTYQAIKKGELVLDYE